MPFVMQLDEIERIIGQFSQAGRWGWQPQFRTIERFIRKKTRHRFRAHKSPDGKKWAELYIPPFPKRGEIGPIAERKGRVIFGRIKSRRQKKLARKLLIKHDWQPRKRSGHIAIYRPHAKRMTGPVRRATMVYDALTKTGAPGALIEVSQQSMIYGTFFDWVETLHKGGMYLGKRVPARPLLGLTISGAASDLMEITKIFRDRMIARMQKKLLGG